jgi:hypothetical protein
MVPTETLWLMAFLSSVRLPLKRPVSLTSSRRRSSQKRTRQLIFPLLAAVTQTTSINLASTTTTIKATDAITTNDDMTVTIKTIDTTITLVAKTRTTRRSPARRKMIANAITSRRLAV